jgi:flavin-dependent dehydrogenase
LWKHGGLAESFRALPHSVLRSFKISSRSGVETNFPYPECADEHRALCRESMDDWLRGEAASAGAVSLTGITPTDFDPPATIICGADAFRARIVLGTDGRNSWVARTAGFAPALRKCGRMAWHATIPASFADSSAHVKFIPKGYLSLGRVSEKQANLTIVLDSGARDSPQQIATRLFPDIPPLSWRSATPVSRSAHVPAQGQVLLAGDAVRLLEPLGAEGVLFALRSATAAANASIACLKGNSENAIASVYSSALAEIEQATNRRNAWARMLARHPSMATSVARLLFNANSTSQVSR